MGGNDIAAEAHVLSALPTMPAHQSSNEIIYSFRSTKTDRILGNESVETLQGAVKDWDFRDETARLRALSRPLMVCSGLLCKQNAGEE